VTPELGGIIALALVVLGATWRLSWRLAKLQAGLDHLKEEFNLHRKDHAC
jgi:hypothetical protein